MNVIECNDDSKKDIWNKFIAENDPESFLQSWEWGEFQEKAGKKIWRLAVSDGADLQAVALVIEQELKFFGNYLYCPRGPVTNKLKMKNEKLKIVDSLLNEIKKIAEKERSLFLKIEPAVEQSVEHETWNISYHNFRKSDTEIQPKNTSILDLAKSKEDLLREMKQKTRYNIRLAEKKGVRAFISSDYEKDFSKFWLLIGETSRRNEIVSHEKDYYLKMLENLKENGGDKRRSLFSRLYLAEYNGKVIAGNIVLFFGDISVYLHGASSNEDRAVMAPYLLQWKQILDAKESGCKSYDFWGIAAGGEKENWEGITRFKKGFGGYEKKYIGAYDLPFNSAGYILYKIARKMRSKKQA